MNMGVSKSGSVSRSPYMKDGRTELRSDCTVERDAKVDVGA